MVGGWPQGSRPHPFPAVRPQQTGAWSPCLCDEVMTPLAKGCEHEEAMTHSQVPQKDTHRKPLSCHGLQDPSAQAQAEEGAQRAAFQNRTAPHHTCCRWPRTLVLQSKTPFPSEEYRLYRNSVV